MEISIFPRKPRMSSVMPTIGMVWVARCAARIAKGDDEITLLCDELADQRGHAFVVPFRPCKQVADVAPLVPADRFHVATERFSEEFGHILRVGRQTAYQGQGLLRAKGERPKKRPRRPAEPCDKLPPSHHE